MKISIGFNIKNETSWGGGNQFCLNLKNYLLKKNCEVLSDLKDDKWVAHSGDCFFQIVDWDENGNIYSESIHQFGSATKDSRSKHYSDQSKLFSNLKMKKVLMDLEEIKNNLEKTYQP